MKPRLWSAEAGIGLGVWLFLMIAGRSRMLRDPGIFWHTVVGRKILSERAFLDTDPFSFTFGGQPWIPYEWLGECAMAVVHGVSGFDGLLLGTATALAVLFGWLAHRLLRGGLTWLPTTLLIVIGVAASAGHFHVRPHIATIFGLALTCAWLADVEAGRLDWRGLWRLIPLFVVWSNIHGGALGGFASVTLVVAGWCILRVLGWESPVKDLRQVGWLGLLILACALSAFVNPYGYRLPRTWLEIMASPVIPRLIVEHAPTRLRSPEALMMGLLGGFYALALAGVPPRRWRASWMLAPIWLVLACSRVRHAPLFSVAALVGLADILPLSRLSARLARPGRDLFVADPEPAGRRLGLSWFVPAGVVVVAVVLQAAGVHAPVLGRGWARLDPSHWPTDLLPELREVEASRAPARFFNEYLLGGFLIYYTPGIKVFIDDRCEVYRDEWLMRYDRAELDPEGLMRWLSEYPIDGALVQTGSGFDRAFDGRPGWSLVRRTPVATLYLRETPGR